MTVRRRAGISGRVGGAGQFPAGGLSGLAVTLASPLARPMLDEALRFLPKRLCLSPLRLFGRLLRERTQKRPNEMRPRGDRAGRRMRLHANRLQCLDEADRVWFMLHSGSRGVGNRIGRFFIELAKEDVRRAHGELPDRDLAYLREGTRHFEEYVHAVGWAQTYAATNRAVMMDRVIDAVRGVAGLPPYSQVTDMLPTARGGGARLFAFGHDAWLVTAFLERLVTYKDGDLGGATGSLRLDGFGNVVRQPQWSMFSGGTPVPAPMAAGGR